MAKNQVPIRLAWRENKNEKSTGYGKYYLEVMNGQTISTRALMDHIMSHGLGIPRSILQAALTQLVECLVEFISQGTPVKLDGFGTIKLNARSKGVTEAKLKQGGVNPRDILSGLALVVIPDSTELDKLTSPANLAACGLETAGVIEGALKTADKVVKSMDAWIAEHQNP